MVRTVMTVGICYGGAGEPNLVTNRVLWKNPETGFTRSRDCTWATSEGSAIKMLSEAVTQNLEQFPKGMPLVVVGDARLGEDYSSIGFVDVNDHEVLSLKGITDDIANTCFDGSGQVVGIDKELIQSAIDSYTTSLSADERYAAMDAMMDDDADKEWERRQEYDNHLYNGFE